MIYDLENKPVSNAEIYLDEKYITRSDINGHFSLSNINMTRRYELRISRNEYETLKLTLIAPDPALVLYVQMASAEQLIAHAEAALRSRDWAALETLLIRAESAEGDALSIGYLRALKFMYTGDHITALETLLTLSETFHDCAFLYLCIADIYEYRLNDKTRAVRFLEQFLTFRYDPDVETRRVTLLRQI
jgi:hypothetical protein